jgi:dihydroflavonol-4-reductase
MKIKEEIDAGVKGMEGIKGSKGKALVIAASGYLGCHVVKELLQQGYSVRALFRKTSDQRATENLDIERVYGDILDTQSLKDAMVGIDFVYHCALDPRAWLRDPGPLYQTNVDGLRNSMDAALECDIKRFIFTSTYTTIASFKDRKATEEDEFNWWKIAPEYVRGRVIAENMFFAYCKNRGLPGVALNIGNTYGADDYALTGQGKVIEGVVSGKMNMYFDGGNVSVGIKDAAKAMLLACEKGRIGERYIIMERYLKYKELMDISAEYAGVEPPAKRVPRWLMYLFAGINDFLSLFTDNVGDTSLTSTKLVWCMGDMDNSKAINELGWNPEPVEVGIKDAVEFYQSQLDLGDQETVGA